MQTKIEEVFVIQASVDAVWAFLMDPERVVECMPGAGLESIEDERNFVGNIELKMGFVAVRYRMQVQFVDIDHDAHFARIEARTVKDSEAAGAAKKDACQVPAAKVKKLKMNCAPQGHMC